MIEQHLDQRLDRGQLVIRGQRAIELLLEPVAALAGIQRDEAVGHQPIDDESWHPRS